jgi:uncharacterized cupin superfamily protein
LSTGSVLGATFISSSFLRRAHHPSRRCGAAVHDAVVLLMTAVCVCVCVWLCTLVRSLQMGGWGSKPFTAEGAVQLASEWMAVLEGAVTTIDQAGNSVTHKKGDVFIVPKGTEYTWKQETEEFKKFYVTIDHASEASPANNIISYDRAQRCAGDEEFWFFCTGLDDLAPGSATPTAASYDYMTSGDGVFAAGLWTCTAHETKVNAYP